MTNSDAASDSKAQRSKAPRTRQNGQESKPPKIAKGSKRDRDKQGNAAGLAPRDRNGADADGGAIDLRDPQYYFNRELSWVEFNARDRKSVV